METAMNLVGVIGGLLLRFGFLLAIPVAAALLVWAGISVARAARAFGRRAAGVEKINGMFFKRDLFYAPGHLWLQAESDGSARIGVDDLAQRLLPDIRDVRLPPAGVVIKKGQVLAELTCGEKKVVIASPVDGTVARVNQDLLGRPELLHDAYRRGWLFQMKPADDGWTALPKGASAEAWFRGELDRLMTFAEGELGVAAADGGEFLLATAHAIPEAKWDALLERFLRAP
jgi:glycine cleavage system H protein